MTQPSLVNLDSNEYSQELHCYASAVNLDRCARSLNTHDDLSNKVCIPNETKDLNLHVLNMITEIDESRTLTKHIYHVNVSVSLKVENVAWIKSGETISAGVSEKSRKTSPVRKKLFLESYNMYLQKW